MVWAEVLSENTVIAPEMQAFARTLGFGFRAHRLYRDETDGGAALVFLEAGVTQPLSRRAQSNFTTTDPGSGANKWFIQNSASHFGDVENRYSVSKNITYFIFTTSGGAYP
jgi:hypothetical protein